MASEAFIGINTKEKVKIEIQKLAKKDNRSVSSYLTMKLEEIIAAEKKKEVK
jgi:hypothetical protein